MQLLIVIAVIFCCLIGILFIVGKNNNRADWGHWATNILDGLIRVYCHRYHRQSKAQIDIPNDKKIILAANHISGIDPFILISATSRPIRFMIAKEEYEKPLLNWMFKAAGCIPVDRTGRVEGAFRTALRKINEGELVALFPQGGIHRSDLPRKSIKPGIIKLSEISQSEILPVRINGIAAPGTVALSVVSRSRISLDVHPVISIQYAQSTNFREGMAQWLLGNKEKIV